MPMRHRKKKRKKLNLNKGVNSLLVCRNLEENVESWDQFLWKKLDGMSKRKIMIIKKDGRDW